MIASFFSRLKIREKIRLISWLASGFALLLIMGAISYVQHEQLTSTTRKHVSIVGAILAANVADALYNLDSEVASTQLKSIDASPYIYSVCLLDLNGKAFSFYTNNALANTKDIEKALAAHSENTNVDNHACGFHHADEGFDELTKTDQIHYHPLSGSLLGIEYPVVHRDKPYGYLALIFSTPTLWDDLKKQAPMFFALFAIGMVLAMLLADRLQKHVSAPLIDLANTMRRIAEEKNYNLRMKRTSKDEIGVMIDQFNLMLSEIDYRDRELLTTRINLENTVLQRTREIERTRSELQSSRDYFKKIVDIIPNPLFVKDSQFRYMICNAAFLNLFPDGVNPLGKTDYDLFPKESADNLRTYDMSALEKDFSSYEDTLPIDGVMRRFTCKKFRIKDADGKNILIAIVEEKK